MLHRILRRNDQERLRQFVGMRVDRDLAFVHGLKQRGLRLRRGAVDFVGQQDVGENRSTLEFERLFRRGVDRDAQNVGRQQVTGKLHALKSAVDGAGEGLSERGLADSGNALNEQVSAREDADQSEADNVVFAANDAAQGLFEFSSLVGNGGSGLRRHRFGFYYRARSGRSYLRHGASSY